MHALAKYLSKEKVNGALWSLLQKHSFGALPLPTTLNLYQKIQQVTPDLLYYLLHDLFKATLIGASKQCNLPQRKPKQATGR